MAAHSLADSSRLLIRSTELVVRGMSPKHKVREKRLRQQMNMLTHYREVHAVEAVGCGHSPVAAKWSPRALPTSWRADPRTSSRTMVSLNLHGLRSLCFWN